jgi:Lactonase, 7-bladed beta-propeller
MSGRDLLFVACLNRKVPYFPAARGKGITVFSFNEATGALTKLSDETAADNPNYLAIHESNRCIYAVSDVAGQNEGAITAYQFNLATRRLGYINRHGTSGSLPAYASLDQRGKFLLIAILDGCGSSGRFAWSGYSSDVDPRRRRGRHAGDQSRAFRQRTERATSGSFPRTLYSGDAR